MFTRALLRSWSHRGVIACVLWPVSLLYQALSALHRQLACWGWPPAQRVQAMVIVVGNVVAGGAGKTPTVISIVQHLKAQGLQVGIVSRGYGRHSATCVEVGPQADPHTVGDEPALLRRSTQVPVFVGRKRHEAATALLAHYPQTQIIVCDDGLQHYGLVRDLEVCVFDNRGCGNGWLLPAGPLRQRWPRRALRHLGQDNTRLLVLHTGGRPAFAGFSAQRHLAPHWVRQDGSTLPLSDLPSPPAKPLMAVAGIAQPESFFAMLRACGLPLAHTLALPDHYDFNSWSRTLYAGYQLICTEKDALKLWQVEPDAWASPLVQVAEPAFFQALDASVAQHLSAPLSFTHGHQTS